jgi:hypothetical protein
MLVEIGAANEDIGMENKQIRFILYKTATRFIFGPLRKGDRRPLARCVHGEIMDLYPDKDHTYVGFKDERDGTNVAAV